MSDAESADEWEVVVPDDDAELLAELRRRGVRPGHRLHVRNASSGKYRSATTGTRTSRRSVSKSSRTMGSAKTGRHTGRQPGGGAGKAAPAFFGSVRHGQPDLAERSQEILRSEFPGE